MKNESDFSNQTPRELGYRMPAEWDKHEAIWLAWPHDPTTFPFRVEKVEQTYVEIVKHIHQSEIINLFIRDEEMRKKASNLFREAKINLQRIHFYEFDYADVWFRDYGPTFVVNQEKSLGMINWIFNSWGEKYEDLLRDKIVPEIIEEKLNIPSFKPNIVLEGGSIDVNGKGTLLTTEQCLLNKNRNPQLAKQQIEKILKDYLSLSDIIWLKEGIQGDDTDGHIDDIARFINPTTIVCAYEEDETDDNHEILKENYRILKESRDQDGRHLTIIKLPIPKIVGENGIRLPASYTNFYIGNDVVLVPIFELTSDKTALSTLKEQFQGREVVGINCSDLVYGLGTIHCISQQQPFSTKIAN